MAKKQQKIDTKRAKVPKKKGPRFENVAIEILTELGCTDLVNGGPIVDAGDVEIVAGILRKHFA